MMTAFSLGWTIPLNFWLFPHTKTFKRKFGIQRNSHRPLLVPFGNFWRLTSPFPVQFHCIEESSLNIQQNIYFYWIEERDSYKFGRTLGWVHLNVTIKWCQTIYFWVNAQKYVLWPCCCTALFVWGFFSSAAVH